MIVTSITPLDKRRFKIVFDDDQTVVLYQGEMKRYEVVEGEGFPEERYREIVETILCKRARERALYVLKSSDKTEQELRRKLIDGYYPDEVIRYALDFVKKYHFIDDKAYAQRFLEAYSAKRSKRQICYDLQQKGIAKEIITQLLEEQVVDEETAIRNFIRKRGISPENCVGDQRRKLMASLGRKGFSYEIISGVMGRLEEYN